MRMMKSVIERTSTGLNDESLAPLTVNLGDLGGLNEGITVSSRCSERTL